jgi:hypothetical protein
MVILMLSTIYWHLVLSMYPMQGTFSYFVMTLKRQHHQMEIMCHSIVILVVSGNLPVHWAVLNKRLDVTKALLSVRYHCHIPLFGGQQSSHVTTDRLSLILTLWPRPTSTRVAL